MKKIKIQLDNKVILITEKISRNDIHYKVLGYWKNKPEFNSRIFPVEYSFKTKQYELVDGWKFENEHLIKITGPKLKSSLNHTSIETYEVVGRYTIDQILPLLSLQIPPKWPSKTFKRNSIRTIDGYEFKNYSWRYLNMIINGAVCVKCGVEGVEFRLERDTMGTAKGHHFNLYTKDGIMITKDHIIPKSKGGLDSLENFQTMCSPCNWEKGDTL